MGKMGKKREGKQYANEEAIKITFRVKLLQKHFTCAGEVEENEENSHPARCMSHFLKMSFQFLTKKMLRLSSEGGNGMKLIVILYA